jgi:glycosyltransferase involved in cell wall biosynthesis
MAHVTLCMIVKDEEAMLADCLASVRDLVDDMVVVDTGSRDATPHIARKAGARVVSFGWRDDFAAARNEALRHVRPVKSGRAGDWVIQLDADERLAPVAKNGLRAMLDQASFDCGMLRLHDATALDAKTEDVLAGRERQGEVQLVARVFRRTPDLAYVDAIHENVMPWLRRHGMRVGGLELDIVHLGAVKEVVGGKAKIERNVRLLKVRLERAPEDVIAYGYLANEYLRAGALDAALEVTERGWVHVGQAAAEQSSIHRLALARAYLMIAHRRFETTRESVRVAESVEGKNPDFAFLRAFSWEAEARHELDPALRARALESARDGYAEAMTFAGRHFAQAFVCGSSSWMGHTRLGTVHLLLGEPEKAAAAFDAAIAMRPAEREARLGRAEASLALGDAAGALKAIQELLDGSPDAWTLAALAVDALGLPKDRELFAARARALEPKGFLAPHRRQRLRALAALGSGVASPASSDFRTGAGRRSFPPRAIREGEAERETGREPGLETGPSG